MRVLVAAWIGSTNLGDELVFAGLRRLLTSRGARVGAISIDPAATRRLHGVGAVDAGDPGAVTRAVGTADLVVFGGGGLLQDISSPFNLPYHLSRVLLAAARRTPVVGLGLGVGELTTRVGQRQVAGASRLFEAIAVRDQASAELLTDIGGRAPIVAADLAWLLRPPPVAVEDRLVVALRPWGGGHRRRRASSQHDTTPRVQVEALAAAIDAAAQRLDLPVHFVALQADRDHAFHRRVAACMARPATFAVPSFDEVLSELGSARVVIAMRYHGTVGAALAGRPTVQISYSGKVAALGAELGPGSHVLDLDPANLTRLPAVLEAAYARRGDVASSVDALRIRAMRNGDALDGYLPA